MGLDNIFSLLPHFYFSEVSADHRYENKVVDVCDKNSTLFSNSGQLTFLCPWDVARELKSY